MELPCQGNLVRIALYAFDFVFDLWVLAAYGPASEPADRLVHLIGGIEPSAPKPIQVHRRGVFHGAEQVRGFGALESPAATILAEGKVEQLAAHDGFAQNIQGRGGLGIGIVPELQQAFRVGHDRDLIVAGHETHNLVGEPAP